MNRITALFAIAILAMSQSTTAQKSKDCYAQAGTQMALNRCAAQDLSSADDELNKAYQQVIKKYSDEPEFLEKLREAQRLWVQFRDAEIKMKYPLKPDMYGSVQSMCEGGYRAQLTRERTKQLKKWLTGIEEGDACSGSVKTPEELK